MADIPKRMNGQNGLTGLKSISMTRFMRLFFVEAGKK